MKRKDYQKPTMKVVQLQHQTYLLAGSNGTGGFNEDGPSVEEMP